MGGDMGDASGIRIVLEALREVNESNRKAMELVSSLTTATAVAKAEQAASSRAIEARLAAIEAQMHGFDPRLRTVEGGHESAKVIPISELSAKLASLTTKHEGLYTKFATTAGIVGGLMAIIVSLISKWLWNKP